MHSDSRPQSTDVLVGRGSRSRMRDSTRDVPAKSAERDERENARNRQDPTREERTFRVNDRFSSRRQKTRYDEGRDDHLDIFREWLSAVKRLRRTLLFLSRPFLSLATAFHTTTKRRRHTTRLEGCEKRLRAATVVIARSDKAHRDQCSALVTHVSHYACELYAHMSYGERGREREREKRSYRRYNTFVSRGKVPRRGSVRCERAASTDRARYDASTWPRASTPTIPSAPRYRPPHYRGPLQTSLVYAKCYYRQIPKLHSDLKLVLVKSFKMKSVLKTK